MITGPACIEWSRIHKAIDFYGRRGFRYMEVPWMVRPEVTRVTLPRGAVPFSCGAGDLIGSAEQGFIQLMLDGQLRPGSYCACSPCFRDDPIDVWHQKYFLKVELIVAFPEEGQRQLNRVIACAFDFFVSCRADPVKREVDDPRGPQIDLEWKGIELGSYGLRQYTRPDEALRAISWVYGTGLAEPRFSQVLQLKNPNGP